jgi:alkanesulfonate monooxygenase SsuD/methylene tetrahydromethanopterin reductase-like flavin-dependent oxidoreductase (luciferase family)
LIGGKGRKRTLPLAAREASEWNLSRLDADAFRELSGALDEDCREIGRDPSDIRRSVMTTYIVGHDEDELRERALKLREVMASLKNQDADQVLRTMRPRAFVGTPEEIAEQMREHAKLGVDLFMLQHFLLDDSDALELLAREVIPAVA